jgi:LPS export ABC transporter protein LptC
MIHRFSIVFKSGIMSPLLVILLLFFSCAQENKEFVAGFSDRKQVASMRTDSVTTLISDSGRIRYRVITEKWEVFDQASDPYWYFPSRVYFERFDDSMRVESVVRCDTATYFSRRRLWVLKKNVHITNLNGDVFETPLMYWDQRAQRVYSDSFIRIEKENILLSGYGFESNQTLTKYTIFKPNGPITLDETEADSTIVEQDTLK